MMTRILTLITAAAIALVASFGAAALAPADVAAQPSVALQPAPGAAAAAAPRAKAVPLDPRLNPEPPPHLDEIQSTGKGMALVFWVFALATIGGAVFVITRRNLIAAVMGMVGSFLGIAAVYMLLYASFLAVIQLLVYAGAIMVLFIFVIMILNRPEDEPVAPAGRFGQLLGGAAMIYLVARLVMILVDVKPPEAAMGPPPPVMAATSARQGTSPCDPALCEERGGACVTATPGQPQICRIPHDWGSVKAVGTDLFGRGVFPFEAISILLLLAVVGAIAIARPGHEDAPPDADADAGGAS